MKRLLTLAMLLLLGTLAYGQCVSPLLDAGHNNAMIPDYFNCANYANSPLPQLDAQGNVIPGTGIRKFVDTLPGLTAAGANNLGQYIPVAVPDTTTYPGTDYYEIAVVQYQEKMHSDLKPTTLRGYVQLETSVIQGNHYNLGSGYTGVDKPHYLGPTIVATKNRPVRILFRNLLPTGQGGNLFIPVDTTVMGSGMGPDMGGMADPPPYPMCGDAPKDPKCFSENRATLHLHGGITPWISDGTPHQWTTPAGENTNYPKGVSVSNVPDMPDPGAGAMTFFYSNQQSARLMFYHDHAWGITRLNVYAGEAAAYLISDATEQALTGAGGPLQSVGLGIPLVIQDKTFVPAATGPFVNLGVTYNSQLEAQDPTWDLSRWGGEGQLWLPHVYMPAANPGDVSGTNAFGRWAYGPWFWPPQTYQYGPAANPYFDPNCDANVVGWCQPPEIPGVPYVSMGMEAFQDTPMVNGTAYPTVTLDPASYRLRILNAANDRFFNLHWYVADATGTEVALNPAEVAAAQTDPNVFPTPDTTRSPAGPSWLQIGTEGGFLPAPVVVPPQVITWVTDPTLFNAGNVKDHSLLLGPAERADVIVDFSAYAGRTLILYNDAPAAFPARDPRYDYYTGSPDLTDTGGVSGVLPGYGPNTRTIMQVKVASACTGTCASVSLSALQQAFQHHLDANNQPAGVFESSQDPIVVGQGAYNSAYGTAFRNSAPRDGFARITDFSLTFDTLSGTVMNSFPFENKAMHDEMNGSFDPVYGRMSGNLGLEAPLKPNGQNIILYPFVNPASEIIKGVELPPGMLNVTPITSMSDGTQIWKITHNGVDTHPIHFHLFNVQLLNRVGWDGVIRKPDPNELGWKETVRISPLEDTIVALRPIVPQEPFGLPDSFRPLNPMMPIGDTSAFINLDKNGNAINPPISNQVVNFGWEYVWHCHILSHEEMDMMRPISVNVVRLLPAAPSVAINTSTGPVVLTWTDGTPANYTDPTTWGNPANEIGYYIERADVDNAGTIGAYSQIGSALANQTTFTDNVDTSATTYSYRVTAYNAVGQSPSGDVLVGPGANPHPIATISPSTLAFGNQPVNQTSGAQSVTLFNNGNAALSVTSVTATGNFAISGPNCVGSVAPLSSCLISVTFTPATTGPLAGSLTVASNDPVNPTLSVSLSGNGTAVITASAAVSPAANAAGWNNTSPVTVSITGQPNGGLAVASVTYSASGAQPIAQTTVNGSSAQPQITIQGTTVVTFTATDTAGNSTAPQTVTVKLDTTAPTASLSPAANAAGWNCCSGAFTITGADNLAGVASITYSASGATTIAQNTVNGGTASFNLNQGTTTVTFFATDVAGNSGAPQAITVRLDLTPPTVTATANPPSAKAKRGSVNVTVSGNVRDLLSGVSLSSGTYTVTNGTTIGTGTFGISSTGNYSFKVSLSTNTPFAYKITVNAKDVAGNTGSGVTTFTVQ